MVAMATSSRYCVKKSPKNIELRVDSEQLPLELEERVVEFAGAS